MSSTGVLQMETLGTPFSDAEFHIAVPSPFSPGLAASVKTSSTANTGASSQTIGAEGSDPSSITSVPVPTPATPRSTSERRVPPSSPRHSNPTSPDPPSAPTPTPKTPNRAPAPVPTGLPLAAREHDPLATSSIPKAPASVSETVVPPPKPTAAEPPSTAAKAPEVTTQARGAENEDGKEDESEAGSGPMVEVPGPRGLSFIINGVVVAAGTVLTVLVFRRVLRLIGRGLKGRRGAPSGDTSSDSEEAGHPEAPSTPDSKETGARESLAQNGTGHDATSAAAAILCSKEPTGEGGRERAHTEEQSLTSCLRSLSSQSMHLETVKEEEAEDMGDADVAGDPPQPPFPVPAQLLQHHLVKSGEESASEGTEERMYQGRREDLSVEVESEELECASEVQVPVRPKRYVPLPEPEPEVEGLDGRDERISVRAAQMVSFEVSSLYYWDGVDEARKSLYTAKNSSGYFDLAVAQNTLMFDVLKEKLAECRNIEEAEVARYNNPQGTPQFREVVASLVQKILLPLGKPKIDASHVVVCPGVSAALELLATGVCDKGDSIVVPTPFYPSFETDFALRSACKIVAVNTADTKGFIPSVGDLQRVWDRTPPQERRRWRMVVLTNPGNPTGSVWPRHRVKDMLLWALDRGMHVLGDEVYAGSIFAVSDSSSWEALPSPGQVPKSPVKGPTAEKGSSLNSFFKGGVKKGLNFQPMASDTSPPSLGHPSHDLVPGRSSFASVMELGEELVREGLVTREEVEEKIHLTYGVSKDFTLNGFRTGFLVTRSTLLLQYATKASMFSWVSQDTQWALMNMLKDTDWVAKFLAESRRRLLRSVSVLRSSLKSAGIPFVEAEAAMFVFLDMRKFLKQPTFEAERELWAQLKDETRIVLMPGESTRCPFPGFFRLNYASVPLADLTAACSRLMAFAKRWPGGR